MGTVPEGPPQTGQQECCREPHPEAQLVTSRPSV